MMYDRPYRPSREVCSRFWRSAKYRCHRCPIADECVSDTPITADTIKQHESEMDSAAREWLEEE
jgi:hypothetical protein